MKIFFCFIGLSAIGSIVVFAFMRNKLAMRNDFKKQRLEEKTAAIIEHLQ
jgi:hypothetical protein